MWRILVIVVVAVGCKGKARQANPEKPGNLENMINSAKLMVMKYANEGYPMWVSAHPDQACPTKLEDLDEFMDNRGAKDPWGEPLRFGCGPALPQDARGIALWSIGADRKDGTDDDIKSW